MFAKHPAIAKRWASKYGTKVKKASRKAAKKRR
jgi:hypothetical protein